MKKYKYLIGLDEAGRGPLCGPVVASAVMFKEFELDLFNKVADSKKLSDKKRTALVPEIQEKMYYAYGSVSAKEIDELNIFWATQLAFKRALLRLFELTNVSPLETMVLVDGNSFKNEGFEFKCIVKGDDKIPVISAASILAKVKRDQWMKRYDKLFPKYGIAKHKGYPTKEHRDMIAKHGACPIHRKSFKLLNTNELQQTLF